MINITVQGRHGHEADAHDIDRARTAAQTALDAAGVSANDAEHSYRLQWEEFDDEAPMTGAALAWIAARQAADIAITDGWADPAAEVFCELNA